MQQMSKDNLLCISEGFQAMWQHHMFPMRPTALKDTRQHARLLDGNAWELTACDPKSKI